MAFQHNTFDREKTLKGLCFRMQRCDFCEAKGKLFIEEEEAKPKEGGNWPVSIH